MHSSNTSMVINNFDSPVTIGGGGLCIVIYTEPHLLGGMAMVVNETSGPGFIPVPNFQLAVIFPL